jgi:hypothetical protein
LWVPRWLVKFELTFVVWTSEADVADR